MIASLAVAVVASCTDFFGGDMGLFGSTPLYTPTYEVKGDEVAVFDTSKGAIVVRLDGSTTASRSTAMSRAL